MVVTLDGELIVKLKPVFGYLHRNHEKIAENTTYLGSMPYTDRLDYLCSMSTNWATRSRWRSSPARPCPTAPVPAHHHGRDDASREPFLLVGFLFNDLGTSFTPLLYAFREREKFLDLFEALSGSRMMCNYQRFGGCRVDPSPAWLATARALVEGYPRFLDEYERMLTGNEIMLARTQGIGRLDGAHAVNAGLTGPVLRASGVGYDVRKVDGYGFYPRFDFRVPLGAHGDTYDRYMMRILEMRESVKILQQAFRDLPAGPSWTRRRRSAASAPSPARPMAGSRARRRAGLLPHQRRQPEPLPLPRPPPLPHQPHPARGNVPRAHDRRRRRHPRQHRHRPRRSGPLNMQRTEHRLLRTDRPELRRAFRPLLRLPSSALCPLTSVPRPSSSVL